MKLIVLKRNSGFTLIELLSVLAIIAIVAFWIFVTGLTITANAWYTESGVLRTIQVDNPSITRVIDSKRHVIDYSIILAEDKDGKRMRFKLDSNILFNYKLIPE